MSWHKIDNVKNITKEEHHNIYGKEWALGYDQLKYLINDGLKPSHALLDIGCGVGRFGTKAINYLHKYKYCGFDYCDKSIDIFKNYECVINFLDKKTPFIFKDDILNFRKKRMPFQFDYAIAFSVFNHIKNQKDISNFMNILSKSIKKGGKLICTFDFPSDYKSYGFEIEKKENVIATFSDTNINWIKLKKYK